ncbi:MAG TPA: LysR family transcriptional regulator [Stellaceae bacterium]|nr:LysR family transcriptional regulator [Stellaceae bacterium]
MEMHQIRYFLAVADTLNFTRAAEQCHVSQPALTRAIQQLEDEMGGLLLRRERKLTHLTDFGRLIEPHLRQMITDAEAAKNTARKFLNLQQAQIRLGIMCTVGPARFMGFLSGFSQANPGCDLTLIEGAPNRLSELLLQGELDLAVLALPDSFNERFDVMPLYRERYCLAFPAGHRFGELNQLTVWDVAGETYLLRINCEYRSYLGDLLRERGLATRTGFRSEREDWIQMMVAAGLGVCFLPEYSPTIPGVRTRAVTDPEVVRDVSLVTMSGRRFSPAVLTFIRAIRGHDWAPETNGAGVSAAAGIA